MVLAALAALVGAAVQSATGFGFALVLSPALFAVMEPAEAVTVEPGVYLPGDVGVRIEDLVIVTDGEPDVLTGFPKELVTVG